MLAELVCQDLECSNHGHTSWWALGPGTTPSLATERTEVLTPAAGEAPVAGGTAGAVSANDVSTAGTLTPKRLTCGTRGAHFMAVAGPSPVVIEEGERGGGISAELGRAGGAGVRDRQ